MKWMERKCIKIQGKGRKGWQRLIEKHENSQLDQLLTVCRRCVWVCAGEGTGITLCQS